MGKSSSMWGKTTGKVGGLVYASSGGEQIVREYNPNVSNPSTPAQVNQRARLKLMSQLSACLAGSIVMQKDGLVSKRNKFAKKNMSSVYAANGTAQITYENIQLTEGSVGLPQITAQFIGDEQLFRAMLATQAAQTISRVVWTIYEKNDESRLSLLFSQIVERDSSAVFALEIENSQPLLNKELVIFAYGMCDISEKATAQYSNLQVENGSDIAKLVANRSISYEDYQFTQTRGATLGLDGQPITPTTPGSFRVWLTASGSGTVSGSGTYQQGQQVTCTATPSSGASFVRWVRNGETQTYSTTNPLIIQSIQNNFDLVAIFSGGGNDSL